MPPLAGQTMTVGENLKRIRLLKGLKLDELCAGICSISQLSKIENGKAQVRDEQLFRFAERLGMSVEMLRATDSFLDRLRDQLKLAQRASAVQQDERAIEMSRAVAEQAKAHGYLDLFVEATFLEGSLLRKLMRWQDSVALLNGLLDSELQLELYCRGEIWGELGHAHLQAGDKAESLRCFMKAVELMSDVPQGHPRELTICFQLSIILYEITDYRTSLYYAREVNRIATEQSMNLWRLRSHTMSALNLFFMGEQEQCFEILTAMLQEAEKNQLVGQIGSGCVNLGHLHKLAGDLVKARNYLERGVMHLELMEIQYMHMSTSPYLELADVSERLGQDEKALHWLGRAEEWMVSMPAPTYLFESSGARIRAKIHVKQGKWQQGLTCLRKALALYEKHNAFLEGYETAVEIAELMEQQNDPQTPEMYRRAFQLYRRYQEAVGWSHGPVFERRAYLS
ncbi:helix-turn-helix transcriptional regulator [Tumebacillus sp. ITR2]|uniref:Helix-turn-helix transcriptional regulator n=1 Tax=Tumebacillus amylolyticus TaxID=2801339 RepID=A0ABS1J6P1_9BACL|nr:helix-turn-helix transcriptional regulator [Tumebacillus amylolyticus]MBL0385929.1 helix-turn-helix transcriptional regulator [Tumebacillus amylolyticus]